MGNTVHRCPNWVVVTTVVNCRRRLSSGRCVMWFSNFSKNRKPTSGLEPLICSLRVCGHMLQGLAEACNYRISRRLSLLRVAGCCTVLRSRWCQSGVNIALPSACADRDLKNREYGQARRCQLRKRVNIEEQGRVPQNPQIRTSVRMSG